MNIIISGLTCSGKTTLSNLIKVTLNDVSIMPQDYYYKNLLDIPKSKGRYLMDSPNAFFMDEYRSDAITLLKTGKVLIPNYDVSINKRISKDLYLKKEEINIFEGLHTISFLNDLDDSLKIFIDTLKDECLERRIIRDKKYGVPSSVVRDYFEEVVYPLYKLYIEREKEEADIVIRSEEEEMCLLKKLKSYY